jgi:drug/metabolite transporter (DMT)-like permease
VLWLLVALAERRRRADAFAAIVVSGVPARDTATPPLSSPTPIPAARLWSSAVLLSGLFFAADLGTWHFSIQLTTVANSTLLANCAALLATLYAVVIQRRAPPPLYFVALTLALGGAFALTAPGVTAATGHWRGDVLALLAAVFYTAYMVAVKRASRLHDTLSLMTASTTITALALGPVALLLSTRANQPFWPSRPQGWWVLWALALLTQVIGQGLIARALSRLSVTLSATGLLFQPVVAAVVAWMLFDEVLRPAQIAGALVLMLGIWLARRSETG